MSAKKPTNSPPTREFGKAKFTEYVYCPLPDDTSPEMVTAWAEENGITIETAIAFFYQLGYRVTFKQNGLDSDLCEVSVFDTDDNSPAAGMILSASADTISLAVHVLCYKHIVLLKNNWTNATGERRPKRRTM